ncbi:MAG: hypothetical protein CMN72_07820 [Sphingomonas sp.]|mgnify:CR=1 FL=1|nr:hypothetical protein [Sphingomonas sp.]
MRLRFIHARGSICRPALAAQIERNLAKRKADRIARRQVLDARWTAGRVIELRQARERMTGRKP